MAINKGYLTADRSSNGDEVYTLCRNLLPTKLELRQLEKYDRPLKI